MEKTTPRIVKCITISSSEDESDCMPKIIDAVSLQGTKGQAFKKYDIFNPKTWQQATVRRPNPPAGSSVTVQRSNPPAGTSVTVRRSNPPAGSSVTVRRPNPPARTSVTVQRPNPPAGSSVTVRRPNPSAGTSVTVQRPNPPAGTSVTVQRPNPPAGTSTTRRPVISKPNANIRRVQPTSVQIYHSVSKKPDATVVMDESTQLFKKFQNACLKLGTSSEVTTKICEKVARAYAATNPEYASSEGFKTMMKNSIKGILTSSGAKPWHIVRSVVNELRHHKLSKKNKKSVQPEKSNNNSGGEGTSKDVATGSREDAGEEEEEDEEIDIKDPKKRRQVKKLASALRKLDQKIQHLEQKEIGLDDLDDEDSTYIKLDRYKAHFTKVYNKYCELTNKSANAERMYLRKISFAGSSYPEINRCLEMFYNKKREFPDFHDVKKLVQNVNVTKKMKWPPIKVHDIAEKTFKEFGEMLKRLRQFDDYEVMTSYLSHTDDPAKHNSELRQKLQENAVINKKREQEVIDTFATKQSEDHRKIKDSEGSGSSNDTSEEGSDSENDIVEVFDDHKKSDDETSEDPKMNLLKYLKLKPTVKKDYTNEDSEIQEEKETLFEMKNNSETKDIDILPEENTEMTKGFRKNSMRKRKPSSISSQSSEGEDINEHKNDKLKNEIKFKEKKRIKMRKLFDEIISSGNNIKKQKIQLSLDSSDEEIESKKTSEEHSMMKQESCKDKMIDKCIRDNTELLNDKTNMVLSTTNELPDEESCYVEGKKRVDDMKSVVKEQKDGNLGKEIKILNSNFEDKIVLSNCIRQYTKNDGCDDKLTDEIITNNHFKDKKLLEGKLKEENALDSSKHKGEIRKDNQDKIEEISDSGKEKEKLTGTEYKGTLCSSLVTNSCVLNMFSDDNSTEKLIQQNITSVSNEFIDRSDKSDRRKGFELLDSNECYTDSGQNKDIRENSQVKALSVDSNEDKERDKSIKRQKEPLTGKTIEYESENKQNKRTNEKDSSKIKINHSSKNEVIGTYKKRKIELCDSSDSELDNEHYRLKIIKKKDMKRNITLSGDDSSEYEAENRQSKERYSELETDNKLHRKTKDDRRKNKLQDSSETRPNKQDKEIISNKKKIKLSTDEISDNQQFKEIIKKRKNESSTESSSENESKSKFKSGRKDREKRMKLELASVDTSEEEESSTEDNRTKIHSLDKTKLLDQELRCSKSTISKKEIIEVGSKQKTKVKVTSNLSTARKFMKEPENNKSDDFYKISVNSNVKNKGAVESKSTFSVAIPFSKKSISSSKTCGKHVENGSVNSSETTDNSEDEISNIKTAKRKVLKVGEKAVEKDSISTINLIEQESDLNELKGKDKDSGEDLYLKSSESNDSSEGNSSLIAIEDSDGVIDVKEDSDNEAPSKFIVKKSASPKKLQQSNDLSESEATDKSEKNKDYENKQQSGNEKGVEPNEVEDESSDSDENVVIISEDILEENTNKNRSKTQVAKSVSSGDSSSDIDLQEAANLCEVNLSDSEPEEVILGTKPNNLWTSSAQKTTQVVQPYRRRKEPTPELCIIMESVTKKPAPSTTQGQGISRPVVQNLVASMPRRSPLIRPQRSNPVVKIAPSRGIRQSVNPIPIVRPMIIRSSNPTPVNSRVRGFNPESTSTPVHQQQRLSNKVSTSRDISSVQKRLFGNSSENPSLPVRPNRTQVPQSLRNRRVTNGAQFNTNRVINHQQTARSTKVPEEEDVIVLD